MAAAAAVGLLGYACATSGTDATTRTPVIGAEAGAVEPDAGPSCGAWGQPCCDGGCAGDASFCSVDHLCRLSRPGDVGRPCTTGGDCQSGLCAILQAYDASSGVGPSSPYACSEPCWRASDCLSGWTCVTPGVVITTAEGTCDCSPAAESCDGKDDNCDGVIDEEPGASAACTAAAGLPSTCVDGGCACALECNGTCVDPTSDPKNCGACGKTCGGLDVCKNSQCICGGALCPLSDGGLGDGGYVLPDAGPDGGPIACVDIKSNPDNCGGCGIVCPYTCTSGCTPLLLARLSSPGQTAVAANGSEVFVMTAASGGVIDECDAKGCNQAPLTVASGLDNTNNMGSAGLLASGGSWIYWPGQTAVRDVDVAASNTVSVFAQPANASVFAVATNASRVFWSDATLGISSCAIGATCASNATQVPMSVLAAAPQVLAADATYVYWMDAAGGVFSASLSGGAPVSLRASDDSGVGFGSVQTMVAAGGRVYYVDPDSGHLMSANGGAAASGATFSNDTPVALATDGNAIYWSNGSALLKCALGATCVSPTWIYGAGAVSLAVDGANLYWVDDGSLSGTPQVWEFHK